MNLTAHNSVNDASGFLACLTALLDLIVYQGVKETGNLAHLN